LRTAGRGVRDHSSGDFSAPEKENPAVGAPG
jgi:hypothetical protein